MRSTRTTHHRGTCTGGTYSKYPLLRTSYMYVLVQLYLIPVIRSYLISYQIYKIDGGEATRGEADRHTHLADY